MIVRNIKTLIARQESRISETNPHQRSRVKIEKWDLQNYSWRLWFHTETESFVLDKEDIFFQNV